MSHKKTSDHMNWALDIAQRLLQVAASDSHVQQDAVGFETSDTRCRLQDVSAVLAQHASKQQLGFFRIPWL
jgi:hypothetical protein